jgi:hypothetical protein
MAVTIVYGDRETELAHAAADGERLWIAAEQLEAATGWAPSPLGLCRGDACVPGRSWVDERGRVDFAAFAAHLGHAVARDAEGGVWAFGPAAGRGLAEGSGPVAAPELELPDLDGRLRSLAEQRGKKVLLYCWASW